MIQYHELDEHLNVITGEVVAHSPAKEEIYRQLVIRLLIDTGSLMALLEDHDKIVFEKQVPNEITTTFTHFVPYHAPLVGLMVESTSNWYGLVDGLLAAGSEAAVQAKPIFATISSVNRSMLVSCPRCMACRMCRHSSSGLAAMTKAW